ncbi:endonuclease, partial [Burkholderia pseudomallei]
MSIEIPPDRTWVDRIRAGWAQFEKDLAAYEPRDIRDAPKADAIMSLPTLAVQIRCAVVASPCPGCTAAAAQVLASCQ